MKRRLLTLLSSTAAALFVSATTLLAVDPARPSVECLPDDTVMMLRVPNGQAFMDAMRDQTKIGKVLYSKERFDKAIAEIKKRDAESWGKFEADLGKYGLTVDDIRGMFGGEAGFAVSMLVKDNKHVGTGMYGWLQPGPEMADKLYKAIQKKVAESDGDEKIVRTDLKISGVDAMQLVSPILETPMPEFQLPGNFDQMTPEQMEAWFKEQEAKQANAKRVKVGETVSFVTRLGDRIIFTSYNSAPPANPRDGMAAALQRVQEVLDVDTGKELFAQFLTAHLPTGRATAFHNRVQSTPGLQQAMPKGVSFVDIVFDLKPIIAIFRGGAEAGANGDPQALAQSKQMIEGLGIDSLGVGALRIALEGSVLRQNGFISTTGQRKGVVGLLDQPEHPPVPADWASTSMTSYSHFSFDLVKLYNLIKQISTDMMGPEEAAQTFQQAEMQTQQLLQTDISGILRSLGTQHFIVQYPVVEKEQDPMGMGLPIDDMNGAFISRVSDQQLWDRIMQTLTPFAMMSGGMVVPAAEQGFTGLRSGAESPVEAAIMSGKNFFTVALGNKVAEQVLSSLSNPPQGNQALARSPLYDRAKQVLNLRPGTFFMIQDGERVAEQTMKTLPETIVDAIYQSSDLDIDPDALLEMMKAILPTAEELKGSFGVTVGQGYVTPQGFVLESSSDMPK